MSNPSKAKGTAWETAIVNYLRDNGWPHAERRALAGAADLGDITGIPGLTLEAKNARAIDLAGWTGELRTEMGNAGTDLGWLVVKRRGKTSPADAYWLTTGACAIELTREWLR